MPDSGSKFWSSWYGIGIRYTLYWDCDPESKGFTERKRFSKTSGTKNEIQRIHRYNLYQWWYKRIRDFGVERTEIDEIWAKAMSFPIFCDCKLTRHQYWALNCTRAKFCTLISHAPKFARWAQRQKCCLHLRRFGSLWCTPTPGRCRFWRGPLRSSE